MAKNSKNDVFDFMDLESVISKVKEETGFVKNTTPSAKNTNLVDIITFCEDDKYLGFLSTKPPIVLTKVQRIILKAFYAGSEGNEDLELSKAEKDWLRNWARDKDKQKKQVIANVLDKHERKVKIYELILVLGRRSGKCRYTNDIINTTAGSMTFGELMERKNNGDKIGILTYDDKFYKKSVTYDFSIWDNGIKQCARITTKRGISETSSLNHPYLVWRDEKEKPEFIRLDKLKIGDKIAIAKSTDFFGTNSIGENKAKLLGYLLGDGGLSHNLRFTSASENVLEDFQQLLSDAFGDYVLKKRGKSYDYAIVKKSGRHCQNNSQKNNVREWLRKLELFGTTSHTKFIPSAILKAPKNEVSAFLSRLFCTDGWACVTNSNGKQMPQIGYCSASKKMIESVGHILLKYGIHYIIRKKESNVNNKKFESYVLTITDRDSIEKFQREINIFDKEDAVNEVFKLSKNKHSKNHLLKNIPKGVWKHLDRIKKEQGLSDRDVTGGDTYDNERIRRQYCPNREKIFRYGLNTGDDFLQGISDNDIYWDEVKNVEIVGREPTVDLHVPGTHIIGGDIISHNTMLASIIATYEAYKCLELYNPQEYYGLAPDNPIFILNIATAAPQAKHLYNEIRSRIRNSYYFQDKLNQESSSEEYTYLLTQYDKDTNAKLKQQGRTKELIKGSIVIQCGHSNSNSLMGSGIICLVFDELAYFNEGSGKSGGQKVYGDLIPATKAFVHPDGTPAARVVQISAPAGKSGVFYSNFKTSLEPEGERMMSFQFPTWECSPRIKSKEDLAAEFKKNEAEAMVRYGAEFSALMSSVFFPPECVDACVEHNHFCLDRGTPYFKYFMHVDPALTNHNYALVVLHQETFLDKEAHERKRRIVIDHIKKWTPSPGKEVRISEVENYIVKLCSKFNMASITFDDWNSASTIQKFRKKGLPVKRTPFRGSYKQLIYGELRDLVVEGRLHLLPDEFLIGEFKSLLYRLVGNGFKVMPDPESEYPNDDYCDCVAGAAHMALSSNLFDLPKTTVIKTKFGMGGQIPSIFTGKPKNSYRGF